jgi:hypothetical protein
MDYNIVQRRFLAMPYSQQVKVYGLAALHGSGQLLEHLQPCILGQTFLNAVSKYISYVYTKQQGAFDQF